MRPLPLLLALCVGSSPAWAQPGPPDAMPAPPEAPAPPPPSAPPPGHYGYAPVPPARPPSLVGIGLRVGAIIPVGEGYAGAPGGGLLLDLSYWYEARYFAIEGRLGIRFDLVRGPSSYVELPIDVAGYVLLGGRGVAVFAGGGLGPRHLWETRGEVVGAVLPSTTERSDSGWGLGLFGRVGLLVGRGSRARLCVSVEYNVTTLVELNGHRYPSALTTGAGVIF